MINNTVLKFCLVVFCSILAIPSFAQKGNDPAKKVLERTIGKDASRFKLLLEDSSDSLEWFEIEVKQNKIHIKANSSVALCKGAYHFIKENNFGVVTWEGANVIIPENLGKDKKYKRVTSSMPYRMYINPCTYGYTMAWWTWERWEQELDWMALHGINMPLALLGQEIIWQEVWEEIGIDKADLTDYYCGPAFLSWFRMGNLYNHHGPLPQSWMDNEKVLQQKILTRMKELGMSPILPTFSGHVPPYFKEVYPEAKLYELKNWGGIEDEKASLLLDPKDPLFTKITKLFLEKYEVAYGSSDLFLADPFNEMLPPVSEKNKYDELAEYGETVYKGLKEYNPDATWVLQGWTFGYHSHFWTSEATKAFLSRIPLDNVMMLDYAEDRNYIWEKLDAFYGCKWSFGYVHNYGGQQSLFGDLNLYHDQYKNLFDNPKKRNLVGYGCLPEAIENNSIVYEYIFDIPWGATNKTVTEWTNNHLANRYKQASTNVEKAWQIALENTYSVRDWRLKTNHIGYGTFIHNNRPTLNVQLNEYLGNPESIKEVLQLLMEEYESGNKTDLLFYDIIDFAQHYTAYIADINLVRTLDLYRDSDFKNGDAQFEKVKQYLLQLELLQVETGGSFTKWCEDAISHATTEDEKSLYLENAKAQITIWGGNHLKDYASKSWSGIINDFYIPRWQILLNDAKKKDFNPKASREKLIEWEKAWIRNGSIPKSPERLSKAQYIKLIKEIVE